MDSILRNFFALVVMTFVIAIGYGVFLTTNDFTRPHYDPVASGHRAAAGVYGLFGTVSTEIKENETEPQNTSSVAHKVAEPYAVTADLSAILAGRLELKMVSLLHSNQTHS